MQYSATKLMIVVGACLSLLACSSYKDSGGSGSHSVNVELERNASITISKFKTEDPTLDRFFQSAAGYAVFPNVGKGAIGVGGAYGKGVVYENGSVVGYTSLSQGTIGLQLGGQAYSEIIFFESAASLSNFKYGNMEFSAQASAVAATAGASADADFEEGVAVFTMAKGGLMYEASIGGQKFSYTAK